MATYAIGDIQGCLAPLLRLLDEIDFNPLRDKLWFVGDLVNRGPDSLDVLRFVRDLGNLATVILGNHDLHLLAVAHGHGKIHADDTLNDILSAPDREALLDWLRSRPMMIAEDEYAMVHAGLVPQWTIAQALDLAREVEEHLRALDYETFLAHMYGNQPERWNDRLKGNDRLRVIVNAMTRMRICTADGVMEFKHKGLLQDIPEGFAPWFEIQSRKSKSHTVLFGHWSALGFKLERDFVSLDSGCLWGRSLSALRLEDRKPFHVACSEQPLQAL